MDKYIIGKWNHNRAHRLAHLIFAVCYTFAAIGVAGSTLIFNQNKVEAFDITQQDTVAITATVGDVTPGPVIVPGGGGGTPPVPIPPPNLPAPTVTVNPEPFGKIPQQTVTINGQQQLVYVFPNSKPAFSGTTTIPGALIYLYFSGDHPFTSTTYANSQGQWLWQAPGELADALYTLTVTAQDPRYPSVKASKTLQFIISKIAKPQTPDNNQPPVFIPPVGNGQNPNQSGSNSALGNNANFGIDQFAIFVDLGPKYNSVYPGQKIVATIRLLDNRRQSKLRQQLVSYVITGPDGKTVLEATDEFSFDRDLIFQKSFATNPAARIGAYRITVKAADGNNETIASSNFDIHQPVVIASVEDSIPKTLAAVPNSLWYLLIPLFVIFLVVAGGTYYKVYLLTAALKKDKNQF